jgi:hypothetical protein
MMSATATPRTLAEKDQMPQEIVVTVRGSLVELVHDGRAVRPEARVGDHLLEGN